MSQSLASYQAFVTRPFETFRQKFPQSVFLMEEVGVASEDTGAYTLSISLGVQSGSSVVLAIGRKTRRGHPLRGVLTLGRSVRNDIEVKSEGTSKFHCFLMEGEDGWVVFDARSRNGTWVNGSRLEASEVHLLRDGDVLRLGLSVVLTYYSPQGLYERLQGGRSG